MNFIEYKEAELLSQRDGRAIDIISSMVISERNGQVESKSKNAVCFEDQFDRIVTC